MATENSATSEPPSPAEADDGLRQWLESVPDDLRPGLLKVLQPEAADLLTGTYRFLKSGDVTSLRGTMTNEGWRKVASAILMVVGTFTGREMSCATPEGIDRMLDLFWQMAPVVAAIVGPVAGYQFWRKDG